MFCLCFVPRRTFHLDAFKSLRARLAEIAAEGNLGMCPFKCPHKCPIRCPSLDLQINGLRQTRQILVSFHVRFYVRHFRPASGPLGDVGVTHSISQNRRKSRKIFRYLFPSGQNKTRLLGGFAVFGLSFRFRRDFPY